MIILAAAFNRWETVLNVVRKVNQLVGEVFCFVKKRPLHNLKLFELGMADFQVMLFRKVSTKVPLRYRIVSSKLHPQRAQIFVVLLTDTSSENRMEIFAWKSLFMNSL